MRADTICKVIKDVMTGKDGESFAYAKVTGTIILAVWLIVSVGAVFIYNMHFDLNGWGGVTTAIYGAINAAIRATHVTEPTPGQQPPQDS